jgi:DNA-binding transcriptional ArsR family regulator
MAMYAYLTDHGSATATSLARALDESTGQTSYHLRQLERHGLVEEDAGRGTGRERLWKSVGFRLDAEDFARDDATHREAARRANEGAAEESIRRVRLYLSLFPLPLDDDTTD